MTDYLATAGAAVTAAITSVVTLLLPLRDLIESSFGPNGLLAAYVVVAVLGFLLLYKLVQLAFAALKYVVIPSVVLALLASLLLPYTFAAVLPFTVAGCSLILLFKG